MSQQPSVHIRRCHICGEINESAEDILKCISCHKSLLPFYYFDKKKIVEYSDNEVRPEDFDEKKSVYGPIRGLTAYW